MLIGQIRSLCGYDKGNKGREQRCLRRRWGWRTWREVKRDNITCERQLHTETLLSMEAAQSFRDPDSKKMEVSSRVCFSLTSNTTSTKNNIRKREKEERRGRKKR